MIDLSQWQLVKRCQIEDDFERFDDEAVFRMTDGSVWYQSAYKYSYHYSYRPEVKIYRKNGVTIMVVNEMGEYVEVQETSGFESNIINEFNGWSGDTLFEFQNGQIWKQDKYQYKYFYAYRPKASVVKIDNHHIMTVKGKSIKVRRLK
jgi:hypothetical protein